MIVKTVLTFLSVAYVYAQTATDTKPAAFSTPAHQNITKQCFDCICKASSDCNLELRCAPDSGLCGPFSMAWTYWSSAGEYTVNNEDPSKPSSYAHCANDMVCATKTVQGYMDKHARDCNDDGVINCVDYGRIHHLGGCESHKFADFRYMERLLSCMEHTNQL